MARHLRTLGVGPDVMVGVCLERTPEMLIGLLGVLKAGGAYVPLDPSYPQSRLALMLDDAKVPVLLTEHELVDGLPPSQAKIVRIDADREEIDARSVENLAVKVSAGHLAYVIYTSGSTGKPKGVQIPHGALTNFLRSMRRTLGMTGDDALLAVTTLSFDIAALELFLPLIAGARVDLVSRDVATDGARLAAKLVETAATVLQATPATWRMLLDGGWAGDPTLTMICGGEALPRPLADRLLDKGKVLWNLYGPTETTIWSSAAKVESGSGSVSIGRPIDKTQMYVLDARFRPVPVGVSGELYIGGDGLARGYLGRPGLTAERFVPDPFSKRPGDRLYQTGDLARWSPEGTLECLGRIDHQVKVRGFRIELGEIEAALVGHPGVAAAAVTTREDATGEQALAAYVVARPGIDAGGGELRRWLRESLPEHMVPASYTTLDALPLTPNGKIDRKALPDPDEVQQGSGDSYIPPRGPVEEALVGIWAELLGRDRVGVMDDFFDLGGHSLFATQLLARVRDTFAVEPTLREFL
ncbi:MAG: amino acid adenylation domain-containing protein, partial [Isosphaeraceae bacterium]